LIDELCKIATVFSNQIDVFSNYIYVFVNYQYVLVNYQYVLVNYQYALVNYRYVFSNYLVVLKELHKLRGLLFDIFRIGAIYSFHRPFLKQIVEKLKRLIGALNIFFKKRKILANV
jgi:hypothetical protein